jgi:hypothetical protein
MSNHNICSFCFKEFRNKYDFQRHSNKKNKCIETVETNTESKPTTTTNNNNGIIVNGTVVNVTVNDMSGKHPSETVSQILNIEPHLYKGAIYNQLRNLKSSNTMPFLDPIPVKSFNDTIVELINKDNHDYICRCILDSDEVEIEDTLVHKVNNKLDLMRKNKLLKNIYPIKDLTHIKSAKKYTFKYKLVFTPDLLSDDEVNEYYEDIECWKYENQKTINAYMIDCIKESLIQTYMDPKNRSGHSLCELNNNVYCKLNNKKVQLLTNEVFAELFKCRNQIDNLIYSNFNKYMIEDIEYDLNAINHIIKSEIEKLLEIY